MNESKESGKSSQTVSDEVVCNVMSESIVEIIDMSEDEDFLDRCREILQVEPDRLAIKLREYFSKFVASSPKKRFSSDEEFFQVTVSEEKRTTLKLLIQDMETIGVDPIEELDGFDDWKNAIPEERR